MIIPPENLEDIAKKFGFGKYAKQNNKKSEKTPDQTILDDGEYFLFPKIKYENKFVNVRLTKNLISVIAQPDKRTSPQWWEFSQQNKEERVIPNTRIFYQLMHRCYMLRNENKLADVVEDCVSGLRKTFKSHYLHTGTKIIYELGLTAEIIELQPDKSISRKNINIYPFEQISDMRLWSYLILAKDQPETELGTVEPIPENSKQFLETLLGDNYEQAGAVLQYVNLKDNGNIMKKPLLWVPTKNNRNQIKTVILGRGDNGVSIGNDGLEDPFPAYGVIVEDIKEKI